MSRPSRVTRPVPAPRSRSSTSLPAPRPSRPTPKSRPTSRWWPPWPPRPRSSSTSPTRPAPVSDRGSWPFRARRPEGCPTSSPRPGTRASRTRAWAVRTTSPRRLCTRRPPPRARPCWSPRATTARRHACRTRTATPWPSTIPLQPPWSRPWAVRPVTPPTALSTSGTAARPPPPTASARAAASVAPAAGGPARFGPGPLTSPPPWPRRPRATWGWWAAGNYLTCRPWRATLTPSTARPGPAVASATGSVSAARAWRHRPGERPYYSRSQPVRPRSASSTRSCTASPAPSPVPSPQGTMTSPGPTTACTPLRPRAGSRWPPGSAISAARI